MSRLKTLVVPAAAAAALALAASASAAPPSLAGTVGPGFTITLKDKAGKTVQNLKPGKYTFVINDLANIHNFHLTGPGVDKATDIGGTGTTKWTVSLKKGSYGYVCDPHASSMNGKFTVG